MDNRDKLIQDTCLRIMGQIPELCRTKHSLRISDDIVLENGRISMICNTEISNGGLVIERYMRYILKHNSVLDCLIVWKMYIQLSSYHILNLFKDDTIIDIYILSPNDEYAHYYICDKEYATCELFGKYIYITSSRCTDYMTNYIPYTMTISEIRITRTIESLLMGG